MTESIYEDVDLLSRKAVDKNMQYDVFRTLAEQYKGIEKAIKNENIEVVSLSPEQRELVHIINVATTEVMKRYGISAKPTMKSTIIYTINSYYDDSAYNVFCGAVEEDEEYGDLPTSFCDPATGLIYLHEEDISNGRREIDHKKLATVYCHELGHKYAVPHEMLSLDSQEETRRQNGIYLSTYFFDSDTGYRVIEWLNEAVAVHLAAEIKYEAGLANTPEPTHEDWGSPTEKNAPMEGFNVLAENLSRFLKNPSNLQHLQTLKMLINPSNFDLDEYDTKTMKRLLIHANLNRNIYTGLIYLLYSMYSRRTVNKWGRTVWDKILDDTGLFGLTLNFSLLNIDE